MVEYRYQNISVSNMVSTQVNPSVNVHLRNTNKQHLILAKFHVNSQPFIGSQSAKFLFNPLKQTINTVVFVRLPQNTSVLGLTSYTNT